MMRRWRAVLAIAAVVAWVIWLRPSAFGGPLTLTTVSGVSMEPTLQNGDLVIARSQESYAVGDVVVFRTNAGLVIHRIVGGNATDGFVTQGDNKRYPDPWKPKPEQIAGKQWLYLPGAGTQLDKLRQPLPLTVFAAGFAALSAFGTKKAVTRRRGRRMHVPSARKTFATTDAGQWMTALVVSSVITLLLLVSMVYSTRQPASAAVTDAPTAEHSVAFSWTVLSEPSTLDPDGVIGPVGPSNALTQPEFPFGFTTLAREILVDITYSLSIPDSEASAGIPGGAISVDLVVGVPDGWNTTLELLPETAFSSPRVTQQVAIDMAEIQALIQTVREETGFASSSHTLEVVPHIVLYDSGLLAPAATTYSPQFTIIMDTTRIQPEAELRKTSPASLSMPTVRAATQSDRVLGMPPTVAKALTMSGSLAGLVVTGLLAAVVFLGLGRGEVAKVQARFRTMFVETTGIEMPQPVTVIDVASLQDLARLSQRDGRIIFQQRLEASTRFFVPDGATMYQYTMASTG